jgi:hypothetical protein
MNAMQSDLSTTEFKLLEKRTKKTSDNGGLKDKENGDIQYNTCII